MAYFSLVDLITFGEVEQYLPTPRQVYSIEELLTYISYMENDIRNDWNEHYTWRLEMLESKLEILLDHPDLTPSLEIKTINDLNIVADELETQWDGRMFRDYGELYSYYNKKGYTERIKNELRDDLNDPEILN